MLPSARPDLQKFLQGKSEHTLDLLNHFINEFQKLGSLSIEPTKSMIALDNGEKRIAWITQFGKNFIHVVFPFSEPFNDNLCFQKVAQVPNGNQYNHHFRMLFKEDVNEEVKGFMRIALKGAHHA